MTGGVVGEVVQSNDAALAPGDLVEDLPLLAGLPGRLEHGRGVLDVRPRAGGDDFPAV